MAEWMYGWMDERMDGWTDGWMVGRIAFTFSVEWDKPYTSDFLIVNAEPEGTGRDFHLLIIFDCEMSSWF